FGSVVGAARSTRQRGRGLGNALDDLAEEGLVLAAGRRGARYEIEQLAILQAVIGDMFDFAVLVEIDGEDLTLDNLRLHELRGAVTLLRNVVEHFIVEGRGGGWCAERQKHLLAAGADRNRIK